MKALAVQYITGGFTAWNSPFTRGTLTGPFRHISSAIAASRGSSGSWRGIWPRKAK